MQFACLKRQILSPAKGSSIKIGGLTTQKPAGTVLMSCNSNWKLFAVSAQQRTVAVFSVIPMFFADVTFIARPEGGYMKCAIDEGGMKKSGSTWTTKPVHSSFMRSLDFHFSVHSKIFFLQMFLLNYFADRVKICSVHPSKGQRGLIIYWKAFTRRWLAWSTLKWKL